MVNLSWNSTKPRGAVASESGELGLQRWQFGIVSGAAVLCWAGLETAAAQDAVAPQTEESADGAAEPSSAVALGSDAVVVPASTPQGSSADPGDASVSPQAQRKSWGESFRRFPFLERYKPNGNLWEMGLFFGVLFPSPNHNLKVATLPPDKYSPALQWGGRVAYFPLSFVGAEVEAFGAGGSTRDNDGGATLHAIRVHAIGQLPFWTVTPFALLGVGTMGAASESQGHDRDPAIHFGAGVKVPLTHEVTVRFDLRDTLTQKRDVPNGRQTHHPAMHLGASFVLGRMPPKSSADADGDGVFDFEDACPNVSAATADGCPQDPDNDGVIGADDLCPNEAGPAPTGCADLDQDGDGVPLPDDQCPDEVGPAPSGCPGRDEDGDGIIDAEDQCPMEAEVKNGFEDDDGCPDRMPDAVRRFTGVIEAITFKEGTAQLEESSLASLEAAAATLKEHPSVRLEVSGHTPRDGSTDRNQELSLQRAETVKQFFVRLGVAAERVETRGAGATEPIADNSTEAGRSRNRRIEFRVLVQP